METLRNCRDTSAVDGPWGAGEKRITAESHGEIPTKEGNHAVMNVDQKVGRVGKTWQNDALGLTADIRELAGEDR